MSNVAVGLLMVFLFYALFLLACFALMRFLPASFLGEQARTVFAWLPPFVGGDTLRAWAATAAEQLTKTRLTGQRSAETASQLAADIEEGAMQAMLPAVEPGDRERIVACPETGQGMVGVTAPEALTIAAYLRKHRSQAEQRRIYEMAVANVNEIASRPRGASDMPPLPCPLQGPDHVCCVYAARPLRCRPLHAIAIAKGLVSPSAPSPAGSPAAGETGHEQTVAEGIEIGVSRALKSAGVDASVYELNSALATALAVPDAAEHWVNGEKVFHTPLP